MTAAYSKPQRILASPVSGGLVFSPHRNRLDRILALLLDQKITGCVAHPPIKEAHNVSVYWYLWCEMH